MQLVVSGNRVLTHGEDCFISTGGTVVCTKTGRVFQNATVVTDCENCPTDIDSVGYEYHAGAFVPCAPYGADSGDGKIMVACDDCATPRNSELRLSDLARFESGSYTGTNTYGSSKPKSITFPFVPKLVIIRMECSLNSSNRHFTAIFLPQQLPANDYEEYGYNTFSYSGSDVAYHYAKLLDKTLYWYDSASASGQMNDSGKVYTYVAIG